jgi:hypothetical protein
MTEYNIQNSVDIISSSSEQHTFVRDETGWFVN